MGHLEDLPENQRLVIEAMKATMRGSFHSGGIEDIMGHQRTVIEILAVY
jgi:hypothetical protein